MQHNMHYFVTRVGKSVAHQFGFVRVIAFM